MQSLRKLVILLMPVFVIVYGQSSDGSSIGINKKESKEELNLVTVHAAVSYTHLTLPTILRV